MNIRSDIPEIFALREHVERRLGKRLITHSDFQNLVAIIEDEQREHVSESTLERLWGYSTRGYATVSLRTLQVLATYGAGCNWHQFCEMLNRDAKVESEYFNTESILSSELSVGDKICIGWLPNRRCVVRYLGDNRFVAEECHNSKIVAGDTFKCIQFTLGKELLMSEFRHSCDDENKRYSYVAGSQNGLTTLRLLNK